MMGLIAAEAFMLQKLEILRLACVWAIRSGMMWTGETANRMLSVAQHLIGTNGEIIIWNNPVKDDLRSWHLQKGY